MEGVGYRKGLPEHPFGKVVNGSKSVEESGSVNRNVSAPASSTAVDKTGVSESKSEQPQKPYQNIARKMTESDIIDQLLKIGKQPSKENKSLIFSMIHHGIPASEEVFDIISKMVKGKNNPKSVESAVVSFSKGLADAAKSVDVLTAFLSKDANFSKNLENLRLAMKSFSQIFQHTEELFSKGLFAGLASIVGEFDEEFKKLSKRTKDNKMKMPIFNRGSMVKDLSAFHAFLAGLAEKMTEDGLHSAQARVLHAKLEELLHEVSQFLNSLSSQSILSMNSNSYNMVNDRFFYWQMPNPLVEGHSNMDILIKKDPKTNGIDPEKSKMILKFETESLGTLGVVVDVNKNKVGYEFHSERAETRQLVRHISPDLRDRMAALNYDLIHIKTMKKKLEIKKYLLPTYSLNNLSRVRAEI